MMVPRLNKNNSNALVNSKPSNSSNSSKNVNSDSTCCNKTSICSKNCRSSSSNSNSRGSQRCLLDERVLRLVNARRQIVRLLLTYFSFYRVHIYIIWHDFVCCLDRKHRRRRLCGLVAVGAELGRTTSPRCREKAGLCAGAAATTVRQTRLAFLDIARARKCHARQLSPKPKAGPQREDLLCLERH